MTKNDMLMFRGLRDATDHEAMAAVRQSCVDADGIDVLCPEEQPPTRDQLADMFPVSSAERLHRSLRLVTAADVVIGYQTVGWWQHAAGTAFMQRLYLRPEWRGQGIEDEMLNWSETNVATLAKTMPGPNLARTFLATTELAMIELFLRRGYEAAGGLVSLVLTDLAQKEVSLPPGFQQLAIAPNHYRQIWDANEMVFRDEPFRSAPTDENYQAFLAEPDFDPSLWTAVWASDQVAGVVFCELSADNVGVISQLSVGEQWRRKGLGQYLVAEAIRCLRDRGANRIYVATDTDNFPAIDLYKSCGFRSHREFNYYQKLITA